MVFRLQPSGSLSNMTSDMQNPTAPELRNLSRRRYDLRETAGRDRTWRPMQPAR